MNAKDTRAASFPGVRHGQVLHLVLSQSWRAPVPGLAPVEGSPAYPSHLPGVADTPYASRDSTVALAQGRRMGLSRLFELPADVLSANGRLLGTITFPSYPGGGREYLFFYSVFLHLIFFLVMF